MITDRQYINRLIGKVLCGLVWWIPTELFATEGHLSIINYDEDKQLLFVNIVTNTVGENKIFLNSEGMLSELQRFSVSGEHSLQIYLPCDDFDDKDYLVYKRSDTVLTAPLSGIVCSKKIDGVKLPRILYKDNGCFIEPRERTLWRISSLLSEKNGYSVYQNLYAVFLFNPDAFIDKDIFKMKDVLLSCPPEELISSIDKQHGIELFRSAEQFKLTNQENSIPRDVQEKRLALDAGHEAMSEQPDDELLLDNVELALVPFNTDEQPFSAGRETPTLEKSKLEDDVYVTSDDVSTDIIDSGLSKAQLRPVDNNVLLAGTITSNDKLDTEIITSASIQVEHNTDNIDAADVTNDVNNGSAQIYNYDDYIEESKNSKLHINEIGCYIEPEKRTLWRVAVMFSKVNGYSVYQNAYAIYNVNPAAFPTNDINRMLNDKLSCPSVEDVAKYSVKQSLEWFKAKV